MGRRSTIDQLPVEIRDAVNRLIREGKTISDITESLEALGADVSRSAAGRYVKQAREKMAHYKAAQEVAGQWVAQLGENPKGDVGSLLAEMLKTVAFQTIGEMDGKVDGKELMFLAKAIRDMEATTKGSMERRALIEKKALERQANAAEETAREQGLSEDQWAELRAKFLGIDPDP